MQGNYLRRQRYGGQTPQFGQRRLHLQFARLQGALEGLPDKGLTEQFLRLQHEKATIGAVQGTRTQLPIAGVEGALIGVVFDATEQIVIGRMWLEHHRRTAIERVSDHQAGAVLLLEQHTVLRFRTVLVHQLLDNCLQHIDLHRL